MLESKNGDEKRGNYSNLPEDYTHLQKLPIDEAFQRLYKEHQHPSLSHICYQVIDAQLSEKVIFYAICYFMLKANIGDTAHIEAVNKFKGHHIQGKLKIAYFGRYDGKEDRDLFMDSVLYLIWGNEHIHDQEREAQIWEHIGKEQELFQTYKSFLTTKGSKKQLIENLHESDPA